jgi:hypothetical protein
MKGARSVTQSALRVTRNKTGGLFSRATLHRIPPNQLLVVLLIIYNTVLELDILKLAHDNFGNENATLTDLGV